MDSSDIAALSAGGGGSSGSSRRFRRCRVDGEDLDDFLDFDTLADLSLLLGDFSRLDVFFDFLGFLSFFVTFLTFERSFSILFSLPRISCKCMNVRYAKIIKSKFYNFRNIKTE